MKKKICANCAHYKKENWQTFPNVGECAKMIFVSYFGDSREEERASHLGDVALGEINVTDNFGCIHFEDKDKKTT